MNRPTIWTCLRLSVLENFLLEFGGCLLIVSHDRYFMDRLVDHLFVFEGDGVVTDYPGNYSQYREGQKLQEANPAPVKQATVTPEAKVAEIVKRKPTYKEQKEFETLEKDMAALDAERKSIYEQLSNASLPYDQIEALTNRIGVINSTIDEKELRWLELSEIM